MVVAVAVVAVVAVVPVETVVTVVAWVVVAADSGQQTPIYLPWMMQMLLRKVKKLMNSGRMQWWRWRHLP